eukprot:gene17366-biopygen6317
MNKLNRVLEADERDSDTEIILKQLKQNINESYVEVKQLDREIRDLMIDTDASDEECEREAVDASEINEKATLALLKVDEYFSKKDEESGGGSLKSASRFSSQNSLCSEKTVDSERSGQSAKNSKRVKVRLPKLELKKFGGRVTDWQEFWDSFKSAIHDDGNMANVDKFKYLRSFLEEPARSVIAGFPLTEADYQAAIDLLQKRYAKPSVIKRTHINEMINLPSVFSEKNVTRLRSLHDTVEMHYRGLEALGVDKESYSSVVVPTLMEKIPEVIRHNMIRFGTNHLDWTVDEFIISLEKELEVRESHVPILKQQQQPQPLQQQSLSSRRMEFRGKPSASALFVGKSYEKKCVFCLESHPAECCKKFKSYTDRKNILLKSMDNVTSVKRDSLAQATSSVPSLDPNATSWVGNTAGSGEKVALQTALANVNARKECRVRVLFDNGSQKTFITAEAVAKLGLEPIRVERLGIKAFGKTIGIRPTDEVHEGLIDNIEFTGERTNKVALVGDIEKAFLNIEVCDNDRDCLRFLWVDDVNAPEPQILVFRFKRVVFGVNSSPFLLNAVLRHHIQMYSETDPEFVKKVTESFFVDDLVSGAGSVEQAYSLYERVRSRMKEGGFTVRKFKTNDTMLAELIEEKERECEKKDKGSGNETSVKEHVGLSQEIGGKTKVLGIPWDTKTDTLQIDFGKHRVNEILSLSKKEEWGHVPGVENPADLGTRGVTAKYLKESELWWQAPKWLSQGEQGWPKRFQIENPDGIEEERKKVITLSVHVEEQKGISKIIDIDSFSALHRLLRVTALVMRFIRNCRNKKEGTEISVGNVKAVEMKEAERLWILDCQSGLQNDKVSNKVDRDDDKRESNEEGLEGEENVGKISGDSEVNEEKTSLEGPERGMNRTPRAAALDARCKTKFMLDSS